MPPPPKPLRLGILVPSSNTALEPLTTALLSALPHITVHFSRFPVTQIALSTTALFQFSNTTILSAAQLLADAHVDLIGWSGTSAGWIGLAADQELCRKIEEATGIRATTSVLGLCEILGKRKGMRNIGLVTPYLDDVQEKILETFKGEEYEVVAESHLRRTANVEFADIDEDTLDGQVEEVVGKMGAGEKVISTFCTNLRAAQRVVHWEAKYPDLIVADTVATVIWDMLRILGQDTSEISNWGKIFQI